MIKTENSKCKFCSFYKNNKCTANNKKLNKKRICAICAIIEIGNEIDKTEKEFLQENLKNND